MTEEAPACPPCLEHYREYLRLLARLHVDVRLQGKVDPSDIVQETQMEAFRKLPDYLEREPMPFHLWLRCTAYERLQTARRQHLGARHVGLGAGAEQGLVAGRGHRR